MSKFSQHNFINEKALVRVDFNVPLDKEYNITDDTRMRAAIPTIKKILNDGGSVILMSHLGRPKEGPSEKYSLKHLVNHLQKLLDNMKILFADDCIGKDATAKSKSLQPGEVLLLENLRFYKEEEKGDEAFAEKLSKLGDVYVNDAFGTAHRAHASTAVIAKFFPGDKKMFGLLMEREVASAEKVLSSSEKPFLAIIGGAKVSDKILIIENLLDKANDIIIGGGMAYTFMKAMGGKIGNSLCEDDKLDKATELLKKAEEKNVCIHLPPDSIIADKFDNAANISGALSNDIPDGWMGLDIGEMACETFKESLIIPKQFYGMVQWVFLKWKNFKGEPKLIAEAVAEATQRGAFSLVGGGDSVAAVNEFNLADKVSYVSTGGGALFEYFEGKTLPGIAAIRS